MDLRKRLARLDRLTRKPEPVRPGPTAVRGGAAPDGDVVTSMRALGLESTLTPAGTLWWREDRREGVPRPPGPIPDLEGILPAGTPDGLTWDDVLFLDTETTGLAGGTGTLPFLLGLAWWDGEEFVVRQLFLEGPGREAPILADLAGLARRFRVVATYNGASFDLPLVRTRALLCRTENPVADLVSWDLLPGARRLWGRGLENCKQQTIELEVCSRERGPGDIPGALIPAVYQDFVRTMDLGLLPAVLRHNRRDMDGMGLILSQLAAAAETIEPVPDNISWSWVEAWSRALICERRRRRIPAAEWARHIVPSVTVESVPLLCVLDAIRLLKRVEAWTSVGDLVQHGLSRFPGDSRLSYEGAVLYEHRLEDLDRALEHAEVLGDPHRLARLRSRLGIVESSKSD